MKTNNDDAAFGTVIGGPLAWLRMEGLLVFILSILLYARTGASWWQFVLLLLTPDVAMAGYGLGARWGAIFYNLAHSYVGPVVVAGIAILGSHWAWLPYVLIWSAHIGMDRSFGYGLKYAAGFKKTHLGMLGRRTKAE